MEVMVVLILASVLVALIFLFAFLWAGKSGQFDDDYSPAVRMLFDDEKQNLSKPEPDSESLKQQSKNAHSH